MILDEYKLSDESYILARYQTILKKLGILTVKDLLYSYPVKYEDYRICKLSDAALDKNMVLEGTIVSKVSVNQLKSKLTTVTFYLEVEDSKIRCTVFNRSFLKGKINYGSVIRVSGHFYQNLTNFTVNNLIICDELNRDIVPTYRIKDISLEKYLEILEKVYRRYKGKITETLPLSIIEKNKLLSSKDTIYALHFADNFEDINKAMQRVKYEELLVYELSMKYLHYMREHSDVNISIDYDKASISKLIDSLPYILTADQQQAVDSILNDLKAKSPMNRLLQGEVGSGKTIVAIVSLLATVSAGYQGVLMCPTEILSVQHYQTLSEILKPFDINMKVLTGSTTTADRKQILEGLKSGNINIVIGTHALFQNDVEYNKLGLVITDEEHRFGVHQRVLIRNKGVTVNYLKMSATPIPRTLAISAYGDTDISIIKTLPDGRKPVITKLVDSKNIKVVLDHINNELSQKHQIYVVTPLIDESESIDTSNALETYEFYKKQFDKKAVVGLIHGKLKAEEKEEIMRKFLNNEIQILVATSVIEVGVNVTNATTIVISGAERFGVATLHQLRGRVMRSNSIPYCFLVPEKTSELSLERLQMVEKTSDGFLLAEYDLKHRGPGEFFGEKQSGSMDFKYADLVNDEELLNIANNDSDEIIKSDELFNNEEYTELYRTIHNNYLIKTSELD